MRLIYHEGLPAAAVIECYCVLRNRASIHDTWRTIKGWTDLMGESPDVQIIRC